MLGEPAAIDAIEERSAAKKYGYDLVDSDGDEAEDRFSLSFCNAFSSVCTPLCVSFHTLL